MNPTSNSPQYALVAYIRGPLGKFVEDLRKDLDPKQAHLATHVTVLPPRLLKGSQEEAKQSLASVARHFKRFQITFGDVDTFAPASPTVFIQARSAERFNDMHEAFNTGPFFTEESWPYVPHLTIVKMEDFAASTRALELARERWSSFSRDRLAMIEELTFVREAEATRWIDLHTISLGKQ
jgi:2'-5' RNA ligase